jgi:hypothetical protein
LRRADAMALLARMIPSRAMRPPVNRRLAAVAEEGGSDAPDSCGVTPDEDCRCRSAAQQAPDIVIAVRLEGIGLHGVAMVCCTATCSRVVVVCVPFRVRKDKVYRPRLCSEAACWLDALLNELGNRYKLARVWSSGAGMLTVANRPCRLIFRACASGRPHRGVLDAHTIRDPLDY